MLMILFWLGLWQAASMLIENSIIFVGPIDVLGALFPLLIEPSFWKSIATSFGKISIGFLSAFFSGILLGSFAYRFSFIKHFLEPPMLLLKAIPVASFVILALIWAGSKHLSVLISFLVVLPMIYVSTISGLESTSKELLEMGRVFSFSLWKRIRFLYLPALLPYLISSCKVSLGMSWKSGIAAEVIGVPANTIGEQLYLSKIYLDTASLFAWTLVVILVSAGFERLFLWLLGVITSHNSVNPHE